MASSRKTHSRASGSAGSGARKQSSTRSRRKKSKGSAKRTTVRSGRSGDGLAYVQARLLGCDGQTWDLVVSALPSGELYARVERSHRKQMRVDVTWLYFPRQHGLWPLSPWERWDRLSSSTQTPAEAGTKPRPS